jgi:MFS family permease
VATLSPASLRGRYQAAFGLSWSLAALLSPALLPPLMTAIGLRAFWGACAALAGLVALAHLVVTRRALAGT